MTEIAIKGASGLGDNIYLYPIVRHFSPLYDTVHVMTDYPVLFESIPNVRCHRHLKLDYVPIVDEEKVRKKKIDIRCTYGPRKHKAGTSQFEDTYIFARSNYGFDIPDLTFEMPWEIKNQKLADTVKMVANKNVERKIALIAAPYQPFGREDKWGSELIIRAEVIQHIADDLRDLGYLCITVGNEFCLNEPMVEYNLVNQTSVTDLIDIAYISDLCVTQIGNLLPIAEAFGKKNITIFSENIPKCEHNFLRAITPQKCVHYKDINLSLYDNEYSKEKISAFCR